jgi:hypothetical protein
VRIALLSAVYAVAVLAFVAVYGVVRLRLAWSRQAVVMVILLAVAAELGVFVFLIMAGIRGWLP